MINKAQASKSANSQTICAKTSKPPLIFLGQGPLADYALETLEKHFDIIFHAKTRADLETVKTLKQRDKNLSAVLASFGVLIKSDLLNLFEPLGILNIHPSLLPKYRGPSPIETAIRNGNTEFGVSIMKLAPEMDAGPLYFQTSLTFSHSASKDEIYHSLAKTAAEWLNDNLDHLTAFSSQKTTPAKTASQKTPTASKTPNPTPQTGTPTYTEKLTTALSPLDPENHSALELHNQVRAYQKFPKSRYTFFGVDCIILEAHVSKPPETPLNTKNATSPLSLKCSDGNYLIIDKLQPAGKKPMDAKSFLNGYGHKH